MAYCLLVTPSGRMRARESVTPREKNMKSETFYADNLIQVTDEWIKMRETAYQVADIKSARLEKVTRDPLISLGSILAWSGLGILLMTLIAYVGNAVPGQDTNPVIILFAILGLHNLAIGMLIREFRKPEYTYIVRLNGTFGKTEALGSKDESYAQKIIEAINLAVRRNRLRHHSGFHRA